MAPPPRQGGGGTRAPALACVVASGVVVDCGERICWSLIVVSYCLSSSTPPRPNPLHCGDGRLVGQHLHKSDRSQSLSISSIQGLTAATAGLISISGLHLVLHGLQWLGLSVGVAMNFKSSVVYSEWYPPVIVSDVAVSIGTLQLIHECELLDHHLDHLRLFRDCC